MEENTSKEQPELRLGKRLKGIASMVSSDYSHIWDCCCDHGLLGKSLLLQGLAETIHFVDIVPELMSTLSTQLKQQYPPKEGAANQPKWQAHCIDVSMLPLDAYSGKHLIVIAGVGGDLMLRFVEDIVRQQRSKANVNATPIDFILCPVYHQFMLRQALINLELKLIDEALILERKQFYEVLYVSTDASIKHPIHKVGELIWQAGTNEERQNAELYLEKTLAHYQRRSRQAPGNETPALKAYKALRLSSDKDSHKR